MKPLATTLLSGGLDSTVATLLAREKYSITLALTFDYGQRAATQEIKAAKAFCSHFKIQHETIKLPWLANISHSALTDKTVAMPHSMRSTKTVWVPNRNAIFVNIAAAFAEAKKYQFIISGFNNEEAVTFPDNSSLFIKTTNTLFLTSTLSHPKLISPTEKMTKIEIAREALRLKFDPHFFWSCYEGGAKMCGHCESCMRVMRAFKTINAWDLINNRFE